jgi:hypothetical protein
VYRPVIIPGGLDVTDVDIVNDDLDASGTPAIGCRIGFAPVNASEGPAADDAYFSASGNALLRNAGRTTLAFQPLKFERPVFLTITITAAAATFASGKVTAIVKGDGIGIK